MADLQRAGLSTSLLTCPQSGSTTGASSYILLTAIEPFVRGAGLADRAIAFEVEPHHIPAADEPGGDGTNVLFADGHVEFIDHKQLPTLIEKSLLARQQPTTRPANQDR